MKFDIPQLGVSLVPLRKFTQRPPQAHIHVKLPVTCEAARTHDGVWRLSAACWILHLMNIDRHAGSSAAKRAVVSLPAGSCTDPPPPHYPPIFSRCELILHIPSRPRPRFLPATPAFNKLRASPLHQPCQCDSQATKYPDDFPGGPPEWCDVAALCKASLGRWRAAPS